MTRVEVDLPEQTGENKQTSYAASIGRTDLSLDELVHLSNVAGSQLPITTEPPAAVERTPLEDRLGGGEPPPLVAASDLLRDRLTREPDHGSLAARGLVDAAGHLQPHLAAALRVLGAPEALIQIDVAVQRREGSTSLRAWYAVVGSQVAQLATADGLSYELVWYPVRHLATGLARAATVTLDDPSPEPPAPEAVTLPYEFFLAGLEAIRTSRLDLLDELIAQLAPGSVIAADGTALAGDRVKPLISRLESGTRGTLRALITSKTGTEDAARRPVGGLVSWILLDDGWRWLKPIGGHQDPRVTIQPVDPADLGKVIAPILAQVVQ